MAKSLRKSNRKLLEEKWYKKWNYCCKTNIQRQFIRNNKGAQYTVVSAQNETDSEGITYKYYKKIGNGTTWKIQRPFFRTFVAKVILVFFSLNFLIISKLSYYMERCKYYSTVLLFFSDWRSCACFTRGHFRVFAKSYWTWWKGTYINSKWCVLVLITDLKDQWFLCIPLCISWYIHKGG